MRPAPFLLLPLLLAAVLASGCYNFNALSRAREIELETELARARFFEDMAEKYRLIGYEYFQLARDARDQADGKRVERYAEKARLFRLYQEEAEQRGRESRERLFMLGYGSGPGPGYRQDPREPRDELPPPLRP